MVTRECLHRGFVARIFDRSGNGGAVRVSLNCGAFRLMVRVGIRDVGDTLKCLLDGLFTVFAAHSIDCDCRRHILTLCLPDLSRFLLR